MKFLTWIKKYSKENNLEFVVLGSPNAPQYRVRNGKKFVDFWANGSLRDIDGKFYRRGASERGYGADNVNLYSSTQDDGCGFLPAIKDEVKKLVI